MNIKDKLLVARYTYKVGSPLIPDYEYDALTKQALAEGISLNPIYEEDEIPVKELREYGIAEDLINEWKQWEEKQLDLADTGFHLLQESTGLSIRSVDSFEKAYEWAQLFNGIEMILTPKIDGINTRRGYVYEDGKLVYKVAATRGRRSDALDITRNMGHISPTNMLSDVITSDVVITSETFLPAKHIPFICEKYNTELKIPRNAGMSMMRVDYLPEDLKLLKSLVFKCDCAETLSEGLEIAEKLGFETVPYIKHIFDCSSFEAFKLDTERVMRILYDYTVAEGWPTDGIVVEVNSSIKFATSDVNNGYSSGNLAFKIGFWASGVYTSVIKEIEMKQKVEQTNCVAIIEPVTATGGQTLSRVNLFNPSVMISRGLNVGSQISFLYKNETTIDLI